MKKSNHEFVKDCKRKAMALSAREREVVYLTTCGLQAKEIAEALHISPATVDCHRAHANKKMEARSSLELVVKCILAEVVDLASVRFMGKI